MHSKSRGRLLALREHSGFEGQLAHILGIWIAACDPALQIGRSLRLNGDRMTEVIAPSEDVQELAMEAGPVGRAEDARVEHHSHGDFRALRSRISSRVSST